MPPGYNTRIPIIEGSYADSVSHLDEKATRSVLDEVVNLSFHLLGNPMSGYTPEAVDVIRWQGHVTNLITYGIYLSYHLQDISDTKVDELPELVALQFVAAEAGHSPSWPDWQQYSSVINGDRYISIRDLGVNEKAFPSASEPGIHPEPDNHVVPASRPDMIAHVVEGDAARFRRTWWMTESGHQVDNWLQVAQNFLLESEIRDDEDTLMTATDILDSDCDPVNGFTLSTRLTRHVEQDEDGDMFGINSEICEQREVFLWSKKV